VLAQKAKNQARCFITIFRSVVAFTKAERFCERFDKYVYKFLICICEYTIA